MFRDKRVLAVVPARGGSKGVALKNLRPVGGVALVARAGHIARAATFIDRAVVSTDHRDIAAVAKEAGLDQPFWRPENLSGDRIGDYEVLMHALETCEGLDGCCYDIVVMLQPTSPSRTVGHIHDTIAMLLDDSFDAVWTVSQTDSKQHPLKQHVIAADGALDYYDPAGAAIIARQQLQPVYHRNGICYAMTSQCLIEQKTIKGRRTGALVIAEQVVNIDTEFDLRIADFLFREGLIG